MKKGLLFGLSAAMLVGSMSFADLKVDGKIEVGHYLNDGQTATNKKYMFDKTEFYMSNDKAFVEANFSSGWSLNQAYIKTICPMTGSKVSIGTIQTGVGKMKYYTVADPQGSVGSEISGSGIRAQKDLGGMMVEVGNFGTLTDTASSTRTLYGVVGTDLAGFPVKVGGSYVTDSSDNSDMNLVASVVIDTIPNAVINAQLNYNLSGAITGGTATDKIQQLGVSFKYGLGIADIVGHYSMALNTETVNKANNESDMVIGVQKKLQDGTVAAIEMQSAKTSGTTSIDQLALVFTSKF
jgi:hypothetical protein